MIHLEIASTYRSKLLMLVKCVHISFTALQVDMVSSLTVQHLRGDRQIGDTMLLLHGCCNNFKIKKDEN
jgi:hypothetical protein